jgi:hypothetical protein
MIRFRDSRIYIRDKTTNAVEYFDIKKRKVNRNTMDKKLRRDGKAFMYAVNLNNKKS